MYSYLIAPTNWPFQQLSNTGSTGIFVITKLHEVIFSPKTKKL